MKRKGFIYGFEALFGGIIILLYLTSIINSIGNYPSEKEKSILYRKELFYFEKYLSQSKGFKEVMSKGEENTFPIFNYFLSPISSYDVMLYDKPPHKPIIGIYTYKSRQINTNYIQKEYIPGDQCLLEIGGDLGISGDKFECKEGKNATLGFRYMLINIPHQQKKSFELLVDIDGDGKYTVGKEGPFGREDIVKINAQYIFIDKLTEDNDTSFAYILDSNDISLISFIKHYYDNNMDNISFIPRISFFTNGSNIKEYDVLFINKTLTSKSLEMEIYSYFLNGGNVIVSKNAGMVDALKRIGFVNSSLYYIIDDENAEHKTFTYIPIKKENPLEKYQLKEYFTNIPFKSKYFSPPSSCEYNNLQPYDKINITFINLSQVYHIAIKKYHDVITLYVDHDGDCNFDEYPDNISLSIGDPFTLENITFKSLYLVENYLFLEMANTSIKAVNNIPSSVMLYRGNNNRYNKYNLISLNKVYLGLTNMKIGDYIDEPLTKSNDNLWKGTWQINSNHTYTFYIEKNGEDQIFYLEKDPSQKYHTGDLIKIDTEIYTVLFDITSNPTTVRFTLLEREEVPVVQDIRNDMDGDWIYYEGDISILPEKVLLISLIFLSKNNEKIPLYMSDKKEENTGFVVYPINIGERTNTTMLLAIRRYLK